MLDLNYFKNDIVILFITILTVFFVAIIFYRKRHGIKFRSMVSFSMTLFYLFILVSGIYFTYHEVLSSYYYKHNLYKEATYRFIKTDEVNETALFSLLNRGLFHNPSNREKYKMLAFYVSKNYYKAIPYLEKSYKNENNRRNSIFLKLYLIHSYFETGNKKGKQELLPLYIEALCFLSPEDLKYFENIIKLNNNLKTFINDTNL